MDDKLTQQERKLVEHWRSQAERLDREVCDGDAAAILAIIDRLAPPPPEARS